MGLASNVQKKIHCHPSSSSSLCRWLSFWWTFSAWIQTSKEPWNEEFSTWEAFFFQKNFGHRTEDVWMSHAQLWPETETSRRWVSFQTSLNSRFESADRSSSDQSDYHERASIRIHPCLGFFFVEEIFGRSCNQRQWCLHTNGMSPLSAVRRTRDWLAWASEECDQFDQVPLHRMS